MKQDKKPKQDSQIDEDLNQILQELGDLSPNKEELIHQESIKNQQTNKKLIPPPNQKGDISIINQSQSQTHPLLIDDLEFQKKSDNSSVQQQQQLLRPQSRDAIQPQSQGKNLKRDATVSPDQILQDQQIKSIQEFERLPFNNKNEEENLQNIVTDSIKLRSRLRLFFLFIFISSICLAFGLGFYYQYFSGDVDINPDKSYFIITQNCQINIFDYGDNNFQNINVNRERSSSSQKVKLAYAVSSGSGITYVVDKENNFFSFNNRLSYRSCEIDLIFYAPVTMQNLTILCQENCYMIINTTRGTFNNVDFKASDVFDINAVFWSVTNLNLKSRSGRFQLNYLILGNSSNLHLERGDIIIQSEYSYNLNWQNSQPAYCISAPKIDNTTLNITGCELQTNDQIQSALQEGQTHSQSNQKHYLHFDQKNPTFLTPNSTTNVDSENIDVIFATNCYGYAKLCQSTDTCTGTPKATVNAYSQYGQIYANIIPKQGNAISENNSLIMDNKFYVNNTINFSIPSLHKIGSDLEASQLENANSPVFILDIGSKQTQSDNYVQWEITYNPAYAKMKPWWISVLSLNIMTPDVYNKRLELNPGFCPYYPTVTQKDIYQESLLLIDTFANQSIKSLSFNLQQDVVISNYKNKPGLREVANQLNNEGIWNVIKATSINTFSITQINLITDVTILLTVILSVLITMVFGLGVELGLVYFIVKIYSTIMSNISDIEKYVLISKELNYYEQKTISSDHLIEKNQLGETDKEGNEEQIDDIYEIKNLGFSSQNYKIFIRVLLNQAPPLSGLYLIYKYIFKIGLIDYIMTIVQKQNTNSVEQFFNVLLRKRINEDEELHNQQKDQISGVEMKCLYEQFCYLNGFIEKKLDDPDNLKLLKDKGFSVKIRNDATTQYYIYIFLQESVIINGPPKISQNNFGKSSMQLFIDNCCSLSKFDCDRVSVNIFIQTFNEFCNLNHLDSYQSATDSELKKDFGIETRFIDEQWVIRDPDLRPQEFYYIDRNKLDVNLKLLKNDVKHLDQKDLVEANKSLILSSKWWLYDLLTVLYHLLILFSIGAPLLCISIFERVSFAPYNLTSPWRMLSSEEFGGTFWLIIQKMYLDHAFVMVVATLTLCFYLFALYDLAKYYNNMIFPAAKFFQIKRTKNDMIIYKLMWILVLVSLYFLVCYFIIILLWFIIGAIVSPNRYLPYAASAAAFISVIGKQFGTAAQSAAEASTIICTIISQLQQEKLNKIVVKIQQIVKGIGVNAAYELKRIYKIGFKLGQIDKVTYDMIEQNAESLLRDPVKAGDELGPKFKEIGENSSEIVYKLQKEYQQLTLYNMNEQVQRVVPKISKMVSSNLESMLKRDNAKLQQNLQEIIFYIISQQDSQKQIDQFKSFQQDEMQLVMDLVFPANPHLQGQEYMENMYENLSKSISHLIQLGVKDQNKILLEEKTILYIFMIFSALFQNKKDKILNSIIPMMQTSSIPEMMEIGKYKQLFRITHASFENDTQIPYFTVYPLCMKFMQDFEIINSEMGITQIMDILINGIRKQAANEKTKAIKIKVDNVINKITKIDPLERKVVSSFLTLVLNFIRGSFCYIPDEVLSDFIDQFIQIDPKLDKFREDKNKGIKKQLIQLFNVIFQLVQNFLYNYFRISQNLYKNGKEIYGMPQSIVEPLSLFYLCKYKEFVSDNDLKGIVNSQFVKDISQKIMLNKYELLGAIYYFTKRFRPNEIRCFFQTYLKLNKISKDKVDLFQKLYFFYTTDDEEDLYQCFIFLQLDLSLYHFLLVKKGKLDPKYISQKQFQQFLGSEQLESQEIINKRLFIAKQSLKQQKKWYRSIEDFLIKHKPSDYNVKIAIISYEQQGLLNKQTVITQIQALSNDKNKLLQQMKAIDIEILNRILISRNFSLTSTNEGDLKAVITEYSKLLNISELNFGSFLILLCESNAEKILKALQTLNINNYAHKSQQESLFQYLKFAQDKIEIMSETTELTNYSIPEILKLSIPPEFLYKIIFDNRYVMSKNAVYQLYESITSSASFITEKKVSNMIDFITGTLPYQKVIQCQLLIFKLREFLQTDLNGIIFFADLINIPGQKDTINAWIDNLYQQFHDQNNNYSMSYLIYSCLYIFFTGNADQIKVKEQSLTDYLCMIFDLPYEFFQSLHSFFLNDSIGYTDIMIKYFRRLKYIEFKEQAKNDKNLEQQLKLISGSSLVTISPKIIEQIINLIELKPLNLSFISKEMNIDIDFLEFLYTCSKIKITKTGNERQKILDQMRYSRGVKKILNLMEIDVAEFLGLIKLIFSDYARGDAKSVIDFLHLEGKVTENYLKDLMNIDVSLNEDQDLDSQVQEINELVKQLDILQKDQMNISQKWVKMSLMLNRGYFGTFRRYTKEYISLQQPSKIASLASKQSVCLTQTLCGVISTKTNKIFISQMLGDIYLKLKAKFVPDESTREVNPKAIIPQSNKMEYAIYLLVKSLKFDPLWYMLFQGDYGAWDYILKYYHYINERHDAFLDPKLILIIVINQNSMPVLLKEFLSDYGWVESCWKACQDEKLMKGKTKTGMENLKIEVFKTYLDKYTKLYCEIQNNYTTKIDILRELASDIQFPQNIIDLVESYENNKEISQECIQQAVNRAMYTAVFIQIQENKELSLKEKQRYTSFMNENQYNKDGSYKSEFEFLRGGKKIPEDLLKLFQQYFEGALRDAYYQTFLGVLNIFIDPREENKTSLKKDPELYIWQQYFINEEAVFYELCCMSSIACLKSGYFRLNGYSTRDEIHYKIATEHIDFLISQIEKYNFFSTMTEFFSKQRVFPFVGLSAGFVIDTDTQIRSNCLAQFSPQEKIEKLLKMYEKFNQDKTMSQYEFNLERMRFKIKWFNENAIPDIDYSNPNYKLTKNKQYFKLFDSPKILKALHKNDYNLMIEQPEDYFSPNFQTEYKIDYQKFIYDSPDPFDYSDYRYKDSKPFLKKRNEALNEGDLDLRSQQPLKLLFEEQNEYDNITDSDQYRTLNDVFRENYKSIQTSNYFKEKQQKELIFYYGILSINGIIQQSRRFIDLDDFMVQIQAVSQNLLSNKKSLQELLSFFISINEGMPILSQHFDIKNEVSNSLIQIWMGSKKNLQINIDILMNQFSELSEKNKETANQLIAAYQGDISQYLKITKYSKKLFPKFNESSPNYKENVKNSPGPLIIKLLWSFNQSLMHTEENISWKNFNILEKTTLSQNININTVELCNLLWQIAISLENSEIIIQEEENEQKFSEIQQVQLGKNNNIKLNNKTFAEPINFRRKKIPKIFELPIIRSDSKYVENEKYLQYKNNKSIVELLVKTINECGIFNVFQIVWYKFLNEQNQDDVDELINNINDKMKDEQQIKDKSIEEQKYQMLLTVFNYLFQLKNEDQFKQLQCLTILKSKMIDAKTFLFLQNNIGRFIEYMMDQKFCQIYESGNPKNRIFISLIAGITLDNIPYIIQGLKQGSNSQLWAAQAQSIYMWKNLSNFCTNPKDFSVYQDNIYKSMRLFVQYIYALINKMLEKFSLQQNRMYGGNNSQIGDDNSESGESQSSAINMSLENIPKFLQDSVIELLKDKIFIDKDFINLTLKDPKYISHWAKWLNGFDILMKDYNAEIFKDSYQILFKCITGQYFRDFLQKYDFSKFLITFYLKCYEFVDSTHIEDINYIPDCTEQVKQFCTNEKQLAYLPIYNNFVRIFVSIQKKKKEGENQIQNCILKQIINTIVYSINNIQIQDNKISAKVKQELKSLLMMLCDYDLENFDIKKNPQYLLLTDERKLEKFQNSINNLIFNDNLLQKQMSVEILYDIWRQLSEVSEFSLKSAKDKMYEKACIKLLMQITGQVENDFEFDLNRKQKTFSLPTSLIKDIFLLSKGEIHCIFSILRNIQNIDENKITLLRKIVDDIIDLDLFREQKESEEDQQRKQSQESNQELAKRIREGTTTKNDVFVSIDTDGSGSLSKAEFDVFQRRLGYSLSSHRINEIFANLKKGNENQSQDLNEEEFIHALNYLERKNVDMTLQEAGLSLDQLVGALIYTAIILILMFVFIFMGISSFSLGGAFGSVINSIIPMGGGLGVSESGQDKSTEDQKMDKLQGNVSVINSILLSDNM